MSTLGCRIEPNNSGLYDLTITRGSVIVEIIKSITFNCAAAFFRKRLEAEHG